MVFNKERNKIRKMAQERKYLRFDEESEDPTHDVISFANSWIPRLAFPSGTEDITIQRLLELAKTLSTVMPKLSDESLFEIDDILYENYEVSQVREYFCSSKSKFLDCVDIKKYSTFYRSIIDEGLFDHELDTFYLRLAENVGGIHFEWIFWKLACSRDERKICLFLKIFKSCLKADGIALDVIKDFADELDVPFFLIRLQKMTIPIDSKMKRIVEFIIKQAGACLEDINKDMLKEPKQFIECSMLYFDYQRWYYHWTANYQYALLDVFMSAKDMNERKEFLKAFLKPIHAFCYGKGSINQGFGMIFNSISENLLSIAEHIVKEACCEEEMRTINQHYDYKIEPYWSECVDESLKDANDHHEKVSKLSSKYEVVNRDQMVSKYVRVSDVDTGISGLFQYDDFIKDLNIQCDAEYYLSNYPTILITPCQPLHNSGVDSFSNDIDQQEYGCNKSSIENLQVETTDKHFFKKFLVYDDFMKCLHLMSILHDAYTNYEVFYEDDEVFDREEGFLSHIDKPVFDSGKPFFMMNDMLHSDLKNKKVSWPLEMAVTKCPFLYLKPNACHLGKEYLKYLEGEHIDKDVHKEIFGYYPHV